MSDGFIKLKRTAKTLELLTDYPNAFLLLSLIAYRAKWTAKPSLDGRKIGEAVLGWNDIPYTKAKGGLTRQNYRTTIEKLSIQGFVTYETTKQGTIVTLLDNDVWDINKGECNHQSNHQSNHQVTINQPSSNHQVTTNKERKKERKKETTTSAGIPAPAADFFDPDKAKAMLHEFFDSQQLTAEQKEAQFKRGIPKMYAALQFIHKPGFVITKTPMAAYVWACNNQPWLEEANQPKKLSNHERIEQHFVDGKTYNGAICAINAQGISFHRGSKSGGAKFEDKTCMATLRNVLEDFGIENPFTHKLKQA